MPWEGCLPTAALPPGSRSKIIDDRVCVLFVKRATRDPQPKALLAAACTVIGIQSNAEGGWGGMASSVAALTGVSIWKEVKVE
jgi:hypothetical protein